MKDMKELRAFETAWRLSREKENPYPEKEVKNEGYERITGV